MKKPILVLTSSFPPSGQSGVQRVVKFIKYLDEFGWHCHVMAGDPAERIDTSLLNEIPETTSAYRRKKQTREDLTSLIEKRKPSFIKKVIKKLKALILVPDADILSIIFRLPLGRKIISRHNIKIIFATMPRWSIAPFGFWLKKLTGAKLVLDFRDPWAESQTNTWGPFKRKIQKAIERWVVTASDVIITNTKDLENNFRSKYPDKKIITITNGYDTPDFDGIHATFNKIMPLTITHTGEFYGQIRNPKSLLIAIGELHKEGQIDHSMLRIHFIGGGGNWWKRMNLQILLNTIN